ncbi:MAG: hypothetical protein KAT43_05195 [Nanoarchaeota archaeon]|nr:hypothetical protein [Nanoarchaeota archaeon]
MNKRGILLFFVLFLLILPLISAEKHMKLLAVEEGVNGTKGNLADLYLKTVDGTGNVYVATFPLTRIDTQISARYAKDVACEKIDHDCQLDFLYTLKSKSNLIGGPSAGAAIAILTIAELHDLELDEKVAVTGTINSGGLIGPVGSLMKKIEAAKNGNLTTVLIAKGTRYVVNKTTKEYKELKKIKNKDFPISSLLNKTGKSIDLIEYGKELNITVVEVSRLDEALSYFTNEPYEQELASLEIDPEYEKTMLILAHALCNRSRILRTVIGNKEKVRGNKEIIESAENTTAEAYRLIEEGNYYSAASFCFGTNIKYRTILYKDLKQEDFLDEANEIAKIVLTGNNYQSLRNLQTYIIVKQRLSERDQLVEEAIELFNQYEKGKAKLEDAQSMLAFARERLHSALAWSTFFKIGEKDEGISREAMKETCSKKLDEAQERFQYATIYYPIKQEETEKEIDRAIKNAQEGDYELCIARATKAKAESDVILSVIGVKKEQLPITIKEKLAVAQNEIATQTSFPIVAYSYYQYANSLFKEEEYYSALLYAEYALEMSNLDVYFKKPSLKLTKVKSKDLYSLLIFILGFIAGLVLYQTISSIRKEPKKTKKKPGKKSKKRKSKRK